ncbi:MAG: iron-sulfur cluster-binding protein [Armatimonadetes bacterium]|nr:iron-sulfur cluster-binding protein [Armatimonadota bacterium]
MTNRPPRIDLIRNVERALRDASLQRQMGKAMPASRKARADVVAELPEWESLRSTAAGIKDHVLANLESYLRQLESQVSALGGTVHWASGAAEARAIITDLARSRGVRRIVKSKSMTTEEISLNAALEAAGARVVETDLGEYVVQLAGERPSHLIAPVIHKPTEEIADLFVRKLGVPRYERPEELARVAREVLRAEFLAAEMGITGVNFAIAESGTLVIVENEGNARLTTARPRIHVAVMGIEKVLPRMADLSVFLRILARSGTGQRASVYVSLLTGPRRAGETDGPEELHLVILDNGRRRLLADPGLRTALRCIRCGACQNECPVYRHAGGHAYGSVYAGPIGAVLTPAYEGMERARDLPFASTLCRACADVCPVKIDLPGMLVELRARAVRTGLAPWRDRMLVGAWTFFMRSPARFMLAGDLGRLAQRLVARGGKIERLPYPLSGWTAHRAAPALASTPFRAWWKSRQGGPR